jgi:hypothetical protein
MTKSEWRDDSRLRSVQASDYRKSLMKLHAFLIVITHLCAGCCAMGGVQAPTEPAAKPQCAANGVPNSKVVLATTCTLVVQTSEMCTYDEAGRLKGVSSEPSGICFCASF